MALKVIKSFYGVALGGFVDTYETQTNFDAETSLNIIVQQFEPKSVGHDCAGGMGIGVIEVARSGLLPAPEPS
ncbi:hypothetical protein [Verrucomicrobium sp. BvORR034]|uniref:hypothetical protein n=1 Tax=Verrucomicrobium sp. BvORR034 TaxID=1396418 RepID=UPI000679A049|nr:hypothetical protein [Verrucomicrobium sp. BvORR034]